jgi:hypothetical protein
MELFSYKYFDIQRIVYLCIFFDGRSESNSPKYFASSKCVEEM